MEKQKSQEEAGFINIYNKIAKIYDKSKHHGKSCVDAHDIIIKEIESINKSFSSVLDIGCGTGELLKKLSCNKEISQLLGIDPAREMLRIANNKQINNAKFLLSYAEALPIESESVDLVISTTSVSHWFSIDKALSEIKRVSRPGSYIIFVEHKKPGILFKILLALINRLATYRSMVELYELFAKMDFHIIKHYTNKKYVITCMTIHK